MTFFGKKKQGEETSELVGLTWNEQASQALKQAMSQAPVPALLKKKVVGELKKAAEEAARAAGRDEVTVEDMMNGLLSKMPAGMRQKVEQAAKQGPRGLARLKRDFEG